MEKRFTNTSSMCEACLHFDLHHHFELSCDLAASPSYQTGIDVPCICKKPDCFRLLALHHFDSPVERALVLWVANLASFVRGVAHLPHW